MIITSKYNIGDIVWFIVASQLFCEPIISLQSSVTDDRIVTFCYFSILMDGKECPVSLNEIYCHKSKHELYEALSFQYQKNLQFRKPN